MKTTHLLAAALITALILACFAAPAAAFSGAGSGTESNPYIITSSAQLQEINNDLDGYYKLGNDIYLDSSWSPIGSRTAPFAGVLDGNGHTIFLYNKHIIAHATTSTYKNVIIDGNNNIISPTIDENVYCTMLIQNVVEQSSITIDKIGVQNAVFDLNGYSNIGIRGGFVVNNNIGDTVLTMTNSYIRDITLTQSYISGTASLSNFGIIGFSNIDTISNTYIDNCKLYVNGGAYPVSTNKGVGIDANSMNLMSDLCISNSIINVANGRYGYNAEPFTTTNLNGNYEDLYQYNVIINGATLSSTSNSFRGQNLETAPTKSFFENTLNYNFNTNWVWNSETNRPDLLFSIQPSISAVTATPSIGGQLTEYTLSVSATTTAAGGITGYQWAYSTDSGNTWQSISGATTATYVWTPGTTISGTVLLKCYITGADGGTVDSYDAGYNIQITVYPPPDISTISVSRPLQKVNTPITLTTTLAESEPATYQWYYSTNGGTTWTPISGATAITAEYTPTTTGTHSVKIVVTNTYGESNELTTNFNVLPTYTPTQISNTSVDINIPGTAKYQGQTQFTLSAELKALEYFDTDRAHLAHDNALYYLDSAERQIIPLAATTGNTISSCYIGQYTGVITDISGNTAFYDYQTNTWQYIEQLSADILASTTTYAATISGTTLNLYNLNGNKVDDIETTLTNLAGNDAANTFAGYSGNTLTYYWLSGNQLSSGSQTLAHTITDVHQVPGTENYVVSTTANTYIVSISNTGAYSQVMETETADPLLHTQATTINVLIGVSDPNEIYVVGSDGETDGTYVSGSTLTDASIAKSTGLYAIAGGADFQAYILGKSESSTWQLTQVVSFGESVDYSQISTTGTYAAVATGLKLYLLEAVDVSTGTYMLQAVIIGSSGNPYAGKLISINGDQIRTDTSGRFLYPVTPNTLYTIVADTTTTEYTATSAALQQIAIRLKPNPFAQSVSYSATYNEETGNFEMLYEDDRDLTQQVTWTIRETGDNTIVHQVTVQPGQTATWPVPFNKVFTGYQISMDAERGSINVENVWMITPAGSQPINIPGLDDTGKNIIFGCVLMIIAGLFGVMFSTKGAIFVVLAAGVMTFLGLLTIPWEIIIVAGLLAVLAALAKGGGGQ